MSVKPKKPKKSGKTKHSPKTPPAHDALHKDFFSHAALLLSFLRAFVCLPFVDKLKVETMRLLSGEFVDEEGRRSHSDTVWQGELVGEARPCYVVILVEFQRTQQWLMPFRVLCYVVQILRRWRREREEAHRRLNKERRQAGLPALPMPREPFPLIFPMVIYNGPDEWRMPLNMNRLFGDVAPDFLRYLPSLEYAVFDLHRLIWDRPELVSSLSAQWVRFMQAGSNEENIAAFDALMRILDSAEYRDLEELRKTFFRWFSHSLRENGMPWQWLDQMHNEPLPEVSRMFTTMMSTWVREDRAKAQAEGHAEGRAEGLNEGEVKGALKNQKENLLDTLADRFGAVPQAVLEAVSGATDLDMLRELTRAARRVESLDAFLALPAATGNQTR